MINCSEFYNLLTENDISFFTGVPDSLLKDFCAYILDHAGNDRHIIASNEGNAIALAAGFHLATGKIGLVYMQNSGEGNAINPLVSLVDKEAYSIPVLLMIGWRGEPGTKDEPQHTKQGKITIKLLNTLGIPDAILPDNLDGIKAVLKAAVDMMKAKSIPYGLVVRAGTFETYQPKTVTKNSYELSREEAIKIIVSQLAPQDIVISTTGKCSRELFEYREEAGQSHNKDFLTIGSMGHSSQIAVAIALSNPDREVYCLDGDGALIMHMGGLATIGSKGPKNFKHIVLNNGAHDSVGGQPTAGFNINIPAIAMACNYKAAFHADKRTELEEKMQLLKSANGPALLEVKIKKGARNNLGRPTISPIENKKAFMRFLQDS